MNTQPASPQINNNTDKAEISCFCLFLSILLKSTVFSCVYILRVRYVYRKEKEFVPFSQNEAEKFIKDGGEDSQIVWIRQGVGGW